MRTLTLTKGILSEHPEWSIGSGIATGIMAVALGWYGGSNSQKIIMEKEKNENRKLSMLERIKLSSKYAAPTGLATLVSTGLILNGTNIYKKRSIGLAAACVAAENSLQDYKDELKKHLPEETAVLDKIEKEANTKTFATSNSDYYIQTGYGDQPFVDCVTGTHFLASEEQIRTACGDLSCSIMSEMSISLEDFFYAINLPTRHNYAATVLGWKVDDGPIRPIFSTIDDTWNGKRITLLDFTVKPTAGYLTNNYSWS